MKHLLVSSLLVLLAGCSFFNSSSSPETRAARHMALADSLEQALMLREATVEYSIVAERFSNTTQYPTAVRKLAFLYMSPLNTMKSDSAALMWFRTYANFPLKGPERARTLSFIAVLERLKSLEDDIEREQGTADSLLVAYKKQVATIGVQQRRIVELERELKQTVEELHQLKEVDVRLSRKKASK